VLAQMQSQGSGRIVAIGSKAGVQPSPMAGVYAASKAALLSLVQTAAHENRDRRIAVNVLLPGTMDTAPNRAAMPQADFTKWIDPAQVANMAVYLMTDQASQISGAAIPVDAAG
jgi:short-subunit dehydrogenase